MPALDLRDGTRLLDYRIERVLGRGGMGVVYLAEDLRLKRKVALKLLAPDLSDDERFRARFLRESEIAASLDHPHVVPIYDAGEVDGELYIAMRYVEGTDLRAVLRREGALAPERVVEIVAQVADALDAAHARGLVHRDVKPSNVLIALRPGREDCYLSDFGLTKSASLETEDSGGARAVGTIDYVAPEQIRGTTVDARADVYSLGCLTYECLTGSVPFRRDAEVAVIYAHLQEAAPSAAAHRRALPEAVDPVIATALAKDPGERYASCGELAGALEGALISGTAASPRGPRLHRRRLVVVVAAGTVVAAATALVGLLFASGRPNRGDMLSERGLASIFGPPGRVHPPGYRVALAERLTSGAAETHPRLGLVADLDTGVGSAADYPPTRGTGELVFRLDVRQINHVSKTVGTVGSQDLLLAPKGTQIGYAAFGPGPPIVQDPLIKEGVTTDPDTRDPVVRASIGVPRVFIPLLGAKYPMTIRVGERQLVLTLNVQRLVFAFRSKRGQDLFFNSVGFYFFGRYSGLPHRSNSAFFATNPDRQTLFGASVSARPCADAACAKLGPAATDSIRFTLPKTVTIRAPARALYGQQARFTGTGQPGDSIALAYQVSPGTAPACTPLSPPARLCAPRYAPFWYKINAPTTTVAADGHWSLATALRSVFGQYASHSANGRYVAVDYVGTAFGGNANGGPFSVFADAPADTKVALARPRITTRQRGKRLTVSVVVPGGDHFVRLLLRLGGRTVATGHLDDHGAFSAPLLLPRRSGRLEARATVRGATPSRAAVEVGRFGDSQRP